MAKPANKKKRTGQKKAAKSASSKSKKVAAASKKKKRLDASEKRFVRDLLIRGEAAKPTSSGELPPGATHRIVEDDNDKESVPTVERERFSLY